MGMFEKQSRRDSRSVCAKFHASALCLSAFTQLLNNACVVRGKLTPTYKIHTVLRVVMGILLTYKKHDDLLFFRAQS